MKKLLHEKLREAAKTEADMRNYYPCVVAAKDLGAMDDTRYDTEVKLLNAIADEIEKYYIPRPRFEDGEPVQFGDEVRAESITLIAHEIALSDDGTWHIRQSQNQSLGGDKGTAVQRPEPKVLDAEGVPCKKGETVWRLIDSTKWEITDIHPTEQRIAVRQLDTEKEVVGGWFLVEEYSHREPDSLKKAVNDLGELLNFPMCDDIKLDKVEEVYNRLTAIMERDYERK